jgi:integrase/recombinase XerD
MAAEIIRDNAAYLVLSWSLPPEQHAPPLSAQDPVGLPAPRARPAAADPLAAIKSLVLDAVSSPHTRRSYDRALSRFLAWYQAAGAPGLTKATVQRYRADLEGQGLAASSLNVHLSAIRKLAAEAADNGLLAPELALGIARIRGARRLGTRAGNWLTPEEATALLNAPDRSTRIGLRDRAMLALLVGCGLRRAELVSLDVEHIQLRDSRWVIPDLAGKGNRLRTVPMPAWVKVIVDEWLECAGLAEGPLLRPLNKGGRILEGRLSEDTVWNVVREYGERLGQPGFAPHDLRRTCAKLCRISGGDLEQIQLLLGHASVQTTERYLGTRQNLVQAVNDNLPVEPDLARSGERSLAGPSLAEETELERHGL